ncbi:hypothetical protein ACFL6F_01380 [Planctomycetota bacterium]
MRLLQHAGVIVLVVLFCGCMPITHMSTAPTVKSGQFDLQAGINSLSGFNSAFVIEGKFLPVKEETDLLCVNAGFKFT